MMTNENIASSEIFASEAPAREFTKKEKIFAFIAAGLGFLYIKLFRAPLFTEVRMGLGAAVFFILASVFILLFKGEDISCSRKKRIFRFLLCIAFSANIFLTSNMLIQFLDMIFVSLMLIYSAFARNDKAFDRIRRFFPFDMAAALLSPFTDFSACVKGMKSVSSGSEKGRIIKNALLGLAIALPSTVIVGALLMSADDGFDRMLNGLLNDGFKRVLIFVFQALLGLPVGCYIYSMCLKKQSHTPSTEEQCTEKLLKLQFIPSTAGVFSAVPVCVMYVMFFFSQINYFISSFFSKLPSDMASYSEYARKGFFELCFVSLINLMIIASINIFCRYSEKGKRPLSIRVMSCVLCVFTLLLIATAMSKMLMYINVYGLTRLRLFTSWFMLLLAVIFIGIMIFMIKEKFGLSRFAVTAFTVMFGILSFCRADLLIAEYNIGRYLDGSLPDLDISSVTHLSADAAPAVRKLRGNTLTKDTFRSDINFYFANEWEEAQSADKRTVTLSQLLILNEE